MTTRTPCLDSKPSTSPIFASARAIKAECQNLTDPSESEIQRLYKELAARHAPSNETEELVTRDYAIHLIRAGKFMAYETAIINAVARRARACWDADRTSEAAAILSKLPKDPEKHLPDLQTSKHGCELLLKRWRLILGAVEARGSLTGQERSMALDMLAIPVALRECPSPLDVHEGVDAKVHLRELVESEIEFLTGLIESSLAEFDAQDKASASKGLLPFRNPEFRTMIAHEATCRRQLHRYYTNAAKGSLWPKPKAESTAAPGSVEPRNRDGDDTSDETRANLARFEALTGRTLPDAVEILQAKADAGREARLARTKAESQEEIEDHPSSATPRHRNRQQRRADEARERKARACA